MSKCCKDMAVDTDGGFAGCTRNQYALADLFRVSYR